MKNALRAATLLFAATLVCAAGAISSAIAAGPVTVPGWPAYIGMGALGGPDGASSAPAAYNISSLTCSVPVIAGEDDFQNDALDVVFTYAGSGGYDAGIIVPPYKALGMTNDLDTLSGCNSHPTRVALVEYTADFSGGESIGLNDLSNTTDNYNPTTMAVTFVTGCGTAQNPAPCGSYVLARHLIDLGVDAMALNSPQVAACTGAQVGVACPNGYAVGGPVSYSGSGGYNSNGKYYGTLILNPDMLGTLTQNSPPLNGQANWVADANNVLSNNTGVAPGGVNKAVSIALCFLTNTYSYTNSYNPNGAPNGPGTQPYDTTYTGTPVAIMEQMLSDGYPAYSFNYDTADPFWPESVDNLIPPGAVTNATANYIPSQVSTWFYNCANNPTYNTTTYQPPNFPNTLDGWVQANNWIIRSVSPKGNVTFGWHDNMYAGTGSDFWLQATLTDSQVASTYSGPVTSWLQTNAPSAISSSAPLGAAYVPDYFLFDRYGTDDSSDSDFLGGATLYNAQSWDNYLEGVGQVSTNFGNIPMMMWQIPASHISNTTESTPEYFNNTQGDGYIFSTAPVYFFGDSNLTSNLSNIIMGPASQAPTTAVGAFAFAGSTNYCGSPYYANCYNSDDYQQYLLTYQGLANNFNWSIDNNKRAKAAANNVFAVLWGCGGCTNVVQNPANACQCNDNGWLAGKINTYYNEPTVLAPDLAHTHDFNGDSNTSDILWRNTSGEVAMWLINNAQDSSGAVLGTVPTSWSVAATRDFNRDGSSDILWLDSAGNLAVWLMNGGSLTSGIGLGNIGTQWTVVGTGDFNGDRNGDILWRNTSTGDMAIWLMAGGQFSSGVNLGVLPSAWTVAGTGDFNGDGTTDILWRNTSTGDLAIWYLRNGQFVSGTDLGTVTLAWTVVGTGDFNGDGTSDILWRDNSGNLAIWLISNGQLSSGATLGTVPTTWSVAETGDFNGDGKSDILWTDTSGDLAIWLMNGAALSSGVSLGNVGTTWQVQARNAD